MIRSRFAELSRIPSYLSLAGATFMLGTAMSFTAPYLSLFSIEEARLVPVQLGIFMTVIAASGVAASTWAGKWSDRHGHHRTLLLAALAAAAAGFIGLCFVRNFLALLFVGAVFLGAGGSALSLVFSFGRSALTVSDAAQRAFATATLRTVLSVAWVFGPSIGALVLAATSFYGLFLFAATCFTVSGLIIWRMPKTARETTLSGAPSPGTTSASEAFATLADAVESPAPASSRLWRAVLALTLMGLVQNATMIVLPLYIVQGLHGSRLNVSVMLGLGALLEIPMMLALGARGAQLNKVRWLAACAAVYVVYFIAVAGVTSIPVLIPMQALSAFVVAVTSCLGMTYIQDLMPASPGAATALFFNAARVGSILSGVLSGLLVAALGYRGTFLSCALLAAGGLVLFADQRWYHADAPLGRAVRRAGAAIARLPGLVRRKSSESPPASFAARSAEPARSSEPARPVTPTHAGADNNNSGTKNEH